MNVSQTVVEARFGDEFVKRLLEVEPEYTGRFVEDNTIEYRASLDAPQNNAMIIRVDVYYVQTIDQDQSVTWTPNYFKFV